MDKKFLGSNREGRNFLSNFDRLTFTNYGQHQKRADRRTTPMADLFEESI